MRSRNFLIFSLLNLCLFLWVFGSKLGSINELTFANYYDVLKNYYTLLYYTGDQNTSYTMFQGMNYPYAESVIFTDNTPLLASLIKALNLSKYTIGIFNLFIIANFIVAPLIAFRLGQRLRFLPAINAVFSLFVVWVNPQIFRINASANLSLSAILLLAVLWIVAIYQKERSFQWKYALGIGALIFFSSFIHLYYLIFLVFIFVPGFMPMLIRSTSMALKYIGVTLVSAAVVFLTVKGIDPYSSMRPEGMLGFNYHLWRSNTLDFITSHSLLDLPAIFNYDGGNNEWFSFIGSSWPVIFILGVILLVKKKVHLSKSHMTGLVGALLFMVLLNYFTSLGNDIILGKIKIFNFLNPLYLASFVTDTFNNFRFLSRFSYVVFIGCVILSFAILNRVFLWKKRSVVVSWLLGIAMAGYVVDTFQIALNLRKTALVEKNLLSNAMIEKAPELNDKYDAFLPLPYFHVGSETMGYIIDDNNEWSTQAFQVSLKNKIPMIASKMSRTPLHLAQRQFSWFQDEIDAQLIDDLTGKKIVILNSAHEGRPMNDEPAKTVSAQPEVLMEKRKAAFVKDSLGLKFYEVDF